MNLVMGHDERVAAWMFKVSGCKPMQFNLAIGLEDIPNELVAGIMFTNWNGSDVEVHFWGPNCLKRRTVRAIFFAAAKVFNVNRVTIRTRKEHMSRGVLKLGAVYEGIVRRLYGPTDEDRHAGKQYAFFREDINRLAGLKEGSS